MQLVYYSTENWDRFETANTIAQWLQTYQSYTIQPCETVGLVLKGIKQLWSKKYGLVKPSTVLFTMLVTNISKEKLIIVKKETSLSSLLKLYPSFITIEFDFTL